jgi:glutamate/tyrosine decarboxylase-like PLP-dependent enzyme
MPSNDAASSPFEHDPETLRRLGHGVVDLMLEIVATERTDPVLPVVTGKQMRDSLAEELPKGPTDPVALLDEIRQRVLPGHRRSGHPRFWGYVATSVDPVAAFADAIASVSNQNVTAWRSAPSAAEMERLVVKWIASWIGFSPDGHGLLVSGGSAANLHGVACSLTAAADRARVSRSDLPASATAYVSGQGHFSMAKAFRLLGLPDQHVRRVAIDDERRMDPADLDRQLTADREQGLLPSCVCASAGTVNTGAIDPLVEIADICARHEVWLHVDGAYGAPAATTASHSWMREAFSHADSLSLDPHKWMFAPLDVGCVLVRDREVMHRTFAYDAEYAHVTRDDPIEGFAFFDYTMELSRRARALKVWMLLKAHGCEQVERVIATNIELRRLLDSKIEAEPRLEALGSDLSICCFRYRPEGEEDDTGLNDLNRRILARLVAEGRLYMSPTTLEGRFSLRVCIVNFRTRPSDIDLLVEEVLRIGADEAGRTR